MSSTVRLTCACAQHVRRAWLCAGMFAWLGASAFGDTLSAGDYASWQWHGVSWSPPAGAAMPAAISTPASDPGLQLSASALNGESGGGQNYSSWQWHGVSYSGSTASSSYSAASAPYATSVDAFVGQSGTASLSGYVYVDVNNSHAMDSSDWAIADARITLTAAGSSAPLASVLSSQDGSYSFAGLAAGTYTLAMATPTNHPGQDSGQSRAVLDANGQSVLLTDTVEQNAYTGVTLEDGDVGTNFNFAELTYPGVLISKAMLLTSSAPILHTGDVIPDLPTVLVPEPGSLVLLAVLGLFLAGARWRRRKTRAPTA